jgi:P27 family predicted phage terminase small subunit
MSKGRKCKPLAVLRNIGSPRAKLGNNGIKIEPSLPECPSYLSDMGKEKWNEIAPRLFNLGILTALDSDALARWCSLWALWRQCQDFIEKNGLSHQVETAAGKSKMQIYPQARLMNQLGEILGKIECQFAMSPSSRASLRITPSATAQDEMTRKFFRDGH